MSVAQLVLGTARFGLDGYGFLRGVPKIAPEECERILDVAWSCGVRWIETAQGYGAAETILNGQRHRPWHLITKMDPAEPPTRDRISLMLELSRIRLGRAPDGFLFHRPELAFDAAALEALRAETTIAGLVFFGVACYTPAEAFAALKHGATMISVPHNLFDMRAWDAGVFVEAERRGAVVLARQPFCQGLLAMEQPPEEHWARVLEVFGEQFGAREGAYIRRRVALRAALETADHIVMGADSAAQIQQDVTAALDQFTAPPRLGADAYGGVSDPICNPSRFAQP